MEPGQTVFFKREGDIRRLKGVIIAQAEIADCWQVRGCRTATNIKPPVFTIPAHQIITDHVPHRLRPKKLEAGHGSGLCVLAVESIKRKEIVTARLDMSEGQLLQARAILEMRRRVLRYLAGSNGISFTTADFDYEELESEYVVATLAALRSAASKAPDSDLEEFRRHLDGTTTESRIMLTITRCAKTAAIRYLKARSQYHRLHVDLYGCERRLAA